MQIITFFRSIFAKTFWYFLTVCSSKAFLTSAFWGLTKMSTIGVVEPLEVEDELLCSASLFPPFLCSSSFLLFPLSDLSFPWLSVPLATWRFFLEDPDTSLHKSSEVTFSLSMPRATRSSSVSPLLVFPPLSPGGVGVGVNVGVGIGVGGPLSGSPIPWNQLKTK